MPVAKLQGAGGNTDADVHNNLPALKFDWRVI